MNKKTKNKLKTSATIAPSDNINEQTVNTHRTDILCWVVLFFAGTILYGHTLNAPWFHDDILNIVDNPNVHDLSIALKNFFGPRGPAYFSFAVNYNMSGLSLPSFHATNIFIHILTSGLVFLIAKRVFPNQLLYALLVAMIFLSHPLQTQAVTYIVQRMASMAAFFGFLCLYLYCLAKEQLDRGSKWSDMRHLCFWSIALVACYLAVRTKENLAILPFAILLFDYFYLPHKNISNWKVKTKALYFVPFFIPPLIITLQKLILPLSDGVALQEIASVQETGITPLQYLVTEFNVIWIYLKLLIVPYPQLFDYVYPVAKTLLTFQNILAFAGLIILLSAAVLVRNRYPHLCFGILWFFLGLAVESTLIPLDPVFEHRLYLSMFGFAIFIVGAGNYFLPKKMVLPLSLSCLLIWGGLSWNRNRMWNDDLVLYLNNAKYVTADDGFNIGLSHSLNQRKRYPETIVLLNHAILNGAEKSGVYTNLANAYRLSNQPDKAIEVIDTAIERGINSTWLKIQRARSYLLLENREMSVRVYREALQDGEEIDLINKELGLTLVTLGRYTEAESYLLKTLKKEPDESLLLVFVAQSKINKGNMNAAEKYLRQAVTVDPTMKAAWFKLGLLGHNTGKKDVLNEAYQQLYQLDRKEAQRLVNFISAQRS